VLPSPTRRKALIRCLLVAGLAALIVPPVASAANVNVVKVATPQSLGAPGGTFTFSLNISSDYPGPPGNLKITSVTDNVYGDVTQLPNSNCNTVINTPIRTGLDARSCSFQGTFTGNEGASQTDTVTVTAECEPAGGCATQTGSAQATVFIACPGCPPGFDSTPTGVGSHVDCKGRFPTIIGTGLGETIIGTSGRDIVQAGPGVDTILGLQGNDRLCGAKGKDTIKGGAGRDFMNGGSAKDLCIGGPGKDKIRGNTCSRVRSVP
jgi:Ca2+-binding RTX toxin-like protein